MATAVVEEYLETIYNITMEGEPVIAARLAEHFRVSAPTVSQTMRRLVDSGFVSIGPDRRITLTATGRAQAEATLRRHRLCERFLAQTMGLDWCAAHEEAHHFEHGLSPLLEERMVAVLGNPKTCPHGNPIPGPGVDPLSYLKERGAFRLSQARASEPVSVLCVSEVVEDEAALLRYLGDRGIRPGKTIEVVDHTPGATALGVRVGKGDTAILDHAVADKIWVCARSPRAEE